MANRIIKTNRSTINTSHSIFSNAIGKYLYCVNGSTASTTMNNAMNGVGKKFTFSFWIKRTRVGVNERLLSNTVSGSENQVDISFNTSNQIAILFGSGAGVNETYLSSNILSMTSLWYNIVISFDQTRAGGSRIRLYINGIQDTPLSTSSNLTTILSSTRELNFGMAGNLGSSSTGLFYKKIWAFWNVELAASEVYVLYNNGTPLNHTVNSGNYVSAANLKVFFDMENAVWGTYFTINDTSGNNNGSIVSNGAGHVQADYVLISPS